MDIVYPTENLTFEKVWHMFQETSKSFRETDEKFKDTDARFKDTEARFKETDDKFKQTREILEETGRKIRETDAIVKNLANLFTTQWGRLVEALVEPACVQLFQDRGIEIEQTMRNVVAKHKGRETMECDILLINSTEIVVIEVKTTFRPHDVTELTEKLIVFKEYFPQYKNYSVYGATAALRYNGHSDKNAYRKGLFVLRSSGDGVFNIVNDKKFKPTSF